MSRGFRTQGLDELLAPRADGLGRLVSHARRLSQATRALGECLPPPFAAHCVVANIEGDTVVVLADGPAWASKARFLAPSIARTLAAFLDRSTPPRVAVIVRPAPPPTAALPSRTPRMSTESAARLSEAARATAEGPLRAALERLAARSRGDEPEDEVAGPA